MSTIREQTIGRKDETALDNLSTTDDVDPLYAEHPAQRRLEIMRELPQRLADYQTFFNQVIKRFKKEYITLDNIMENHKDVIDPSQERALSFTVSNRGNFCDGLQAYLKDIDPAILSQLESIRAYFKLFAKEMPSLEIPGAYHDHTKDIGEHIGSLSDLLNAAQARYHIQRQFLEAEKKGIDESRNAGGLLPRQDDAMRYLKRLQEAICLEKISFEDCTFPQRSYDFYMEPESKHLGFFQKLKETYNAGKLFNLSYGKQKARNILYAPNVQSNFTAALVVGGWMYHLASVPPDPIAQRLGLGIASVGVSGLLAGLLEKIGKNARDYIQKAHTQSNYDKLVNTMQDLVYQETNIRDANPL